MLAGLRRPHAGTVTLDGNNIARFPKKQLARRIAFVEQMQQGQVIATGSPQEILTEALLWDVFRVKTKIEISAFHGSWLLSYNQLYLALPVEIARAGGSEKDLGPLFMLASLLIILFQLPLARFARRIGAVRILPAGFLLLSASFLSVAFFAAAPPPDSWMRLFPAASFVTLLTVGQMLLVPCAKDLIPEFASPATLGAHYGALSTAGGVAVLVGNLLLGNQLDRALTPSADAIIPWLQLAAFPFFSAIALFFICRPMLASVKNG